MEIFMHIISKKLFIGVILAVSSCAISISAAADSHQKKNKQLVGRWGFTTDQTCSRSLAGPPGVHAINPETMQFNTAIDIVDMAGVGEMVFYPDGRFEVTGGRAAEMDKSNLTAGTAPVTDNFYPICDGTYEIVGKNQFMVNWNCAINVPAQGIDIKAGPVLVDGFVDSIGQNISMNLQQNIQTLTVYKNGNAIGERQRICIQRFSLIKIGSR
jgi:hypothetical protein